MKIIQQKQPMEDWRLEVTCTGGTWNQQGKVPCGSLLEIVTQDIFARKWSKYPNISGTDYGFICPVCSCFTELKQQDVPNELKNLAKDYATTQLITKEGK